MRVKIQPWAKDSCGMSIPRPITTKSGIPVIRMIFKSTTFPGWRAETAKTDAITKEKPADDRNSANGVPIRNIDETGGPHRDYRYHFERKAV
jgi:hypothetical protein